MAHSGYIRVSSVDQCAERQLDGTVLDRLFEDKAGGRNARRPALIECRNFLQIMGFVFVGAFLEGVFPLPARAAYATRQKTLQRRKVRQPEPRYSRVAKSSRLFSCQETEQMYAPFLRGDTP
jgi:hypothetical protein